MANKQLPPAIQAALSDLRRRIRTYVVLEGLALAAAWIGLTFWIGLAIDYLPVLVWASEIPRSIRAVGLALVAVVLAWILFQWVVRRLLTQLSDRSMALLIERRFGDLDDGLMTTVELDETAADAAFDPRLLAATRQQAERELAHHHLGAIFDSRPLVRNVVLAGALLLPIVALQLLKPQVTQTWVQRFYALRDIPWPRSTVIEVVGLDVTRSGQLTAPLSMRFVDRTLKVARGANGRLRVKARSRKRGDPAPDYCTIYYRTESGVRSSVKMAPVGRVAPGGYQLYEISSKPFQGILDDLEFDIKANDLRLNGYRLRVVDSPEVVGVIQLDCKFPKYLVDAKTSSFLPQTMDYVPKGTQLPVGTDVTVKMTSDKPLLAVRAMSADGEQSQPVALTSETTFEFPIGALMDTWTMEFVLRDQDDVESEAPVRVQLTVRGDEPPSLDTVSHPGIGSLVTPNFVLPIVGEVRDRYRVNEVWAEVVIAGKADPERFPLATGATQVVPLDDQTIDFRAARAREKAPVELKVKDRLSITIMASDLYDLTGEPNVGASASLELEVVTPEQLLAALDQRELAQRKAFEHIMEEMTATRDDLERVRQSSSQAAGAVDPLEALEQEGDAKLSPEQIKRRQAALRMLRVQQAGLQSEKSSSESVAVAEAFQAILLEMTNNRLESSDRHERIQTKIVEPVLTIGQTMFPELDARLEKLEQSFNDPEKNRAAAELAVAQVDDILEEMNLVLQDMLYIETYNELVETVRLLLEEHSRILEETQNERKRSALEGLLD